MLLQLICGSIFSFKMIAAKKILGYIKITRPVNVLITFWVIVVAVLITQKNPTDIIVMIMASLAAALTAAGGNIINDIFDVETDKISHPDRPLVKSKLSKREAWFEYIFLSPISLIIALQLSLIVFFIVLLSSIILFIYSAYLKKKSIIGNITIAALTGLAFIYGGVVTSNLQGAIIPAVFAFLINLIREIVKDIQDVDGDAKSNFKTFPVKYGFDKSKNLILVITLILILSTLYPFITQHYRIEYFILVMIIVNPVLIYCLKLLYNKKIALASKLLKLNMIFGLLAIFSGR